MGWKKEGKIQWKALVHNLLEVHAPNRVKVVRLAKLLAEASGQEFDRQRHKAVLLKKIASHPSFTVDGKQVVRMASTSELKQ